MDALKTFFVELPHNIDFKEDVRVKVNVYKALYYAATNDGEFLDQLFAPLSDSEIALLNNYGWVPSQILGKPFYQSVRKEKYTHPPTQICGRIFKRGEPVYRCFDCAYDDTCVLCSYCFNPDDHKDHTVSFYYANEDSSGMCDCGDDMAFTADLRCPASSDSRLDQRFEEALERTLQFALDYILDVTNFSIGTLPYIHNNIDGRGSLNLTTKQLSELSSLPIDSYAAPDVNTDDKWYLVLWNDEHHDYDDACSGIRAATGVNQHKAKEIAEEINRTGRCILKTAADYTELLPNQKLAEVDGLVATIMSARDYRRERIVSHMLSWISMLLAFTGNSALRNQARRLLSSLLLRPGHQFSKLIPTELLRSTTLDMKTECFKCGILYNDEILDLALTKVKPGVTGSSLNQPIESILHRNLDKNLCGSRLQHFLLFEIRFPLHERKLLEKVLLPTLTATDQDKAAFCEQYIDIYPTLLNVLAFSDREEQLSSMPAINVQLFTCPKTNERVIRSGKLGNILGPLATLIEKHSTRFNEHNGYPNIVEILVDLRSRRQKSSIDKAITSAINDVSHIVGKNNADDILELILSQDSLIFFLIFQKYFQGALPVKRKYGEHVERELFGELLVFLQRAIPMLYIVKCLFDSNEASHQSLKHGLQTTIDFLCLRKIEFNEKEEIMCQVSKDPVSFLNPSNSFLSYLIQKSDFNLVKSVLEKVDKSFLRISDFSLRSIVLSSQIKIGFWIRNGLSVSRQAAYYSEPSMYRLAFLREYLARYHVDTPMSGMAFSRDFHLCQVAAVLEDPVKVFENILDRWEIKQWFQGDVDANGTIYEERFDYVCEQLITFLYCLITDRLLFNENSEKLKETTMKNAICYALCEAPRTYSNLVLGLGKDITEHDAFEDMLSKYAEYKPPSGLTDSGVYRLKVEYSHEIDPISLNLDSSQFQVVMESLIRNIAASRKIDESKVVLMPVVTHCPSSYVEEHLSDLARTQKFAKFIYKLLQHCIHTKEEVYIYQLLHLLHALVVLHEDVDNFINIPICDLLLAIAESEMSKPVLVKADYLLTVFIKKDTRVMESLVDCFGEEHIQLYKKRKGSPLESTGEKRKKSVEDKKARVLQKIAKQREQFLANNPTENDPSQADGDNEDGTRACVICGEPQTANGLFGILVGASESSILWKVPNDNPQLITRALANYGSFNEYGEESVIYRGGYPYKEVQRSCDTSAYISTSCAHGIHYSCFKSQLGQLGFIPCPLCHNLYDGFLPTFPSNGKSFLSRELLNLDDRNETGLNANTMQIDQNRSESLLANLDPTLTKNNFSVLKSFKDDVGEGFHKLCQKSTDKSPSPGNELSKIPTLISDTIKANETASRLRYDGYYQFTNELSYQTRSLIRSLVHCHAYLDRFAFDNYDSSDKDPVLRLESYSRGKGALHETVSSLLLLDKPFSEIVKVSYLRLLGALTFELLTQFNNELMVSGTKALELESDESSLKIFDEYLTLFGDFFTKSVLGSKQPKMALLNGWFHFLQRVVLAYLRQCFMLWDIIICKEVDTNTFESLSEVEDFLSNLEGLTPSEILPQLCRFFGVPDLLTCMKSIVDAEDLSDNVVCKAFDEATLSESSGLVDFPGTVSLVKLPETYNECIIDPHFKRMNVKFDCVCLACGQYLKPTEHSSHTTNCCKLPIYYSPYNNEMTMIIKFIFHPIEVKIAAPYLTVHGEVKRGFSSDKAVLSAERYAELNRLWINQGLLSFATRSLFGASFAPNVMPRTQEMEEDLIEVDDDDVEAEEEELAEGFFAPYDPTEFDDF